MAKALKSLPDFKKAIVTKDAKLLTGIFGFTQKTATKLINALKDKMSELKISGEGKIRVSGGLSGSLEPILSRVFQALLSLGFTNSQSKKAIDILHSEGIESEVTTEELIKKALKVV